MKTESFVFRHKGVPVMPVGIQAHNSSAYSVRELKNAFQAARICRCNSIAVPVYWEMIEPKQGKFQMEHVGELIRMAREQGLYLFLIWFGTWKNGCMKYVPEWIKKDTQTYQRVITKDGNPLPVLSVCCEENRDADRRAFQKLMEYIRKTDEEENTVLAVQIENEPGIMGVVRDYSRQAEQEFMGELPARLRTAMERFPESLPAKKWKSGGGKSENWKSAFTDQAAEYYTAYKTAEYIETIAAAGKEIYDIPVYINVQVDQYKWQFPGCHYPSGGAAGKVLDIWKWFAPSLDLIAPDIYLLDSRAYRKCCRTYSRPDNPLFIPESGPSESNSRYLFEAVGAYGAIGYFLFGAEGILTEEGNLDPDFSHIAGSMQALAHIAPVWPGLKGKAAVGVVDQMEYMAVQRLEFKEYVGLVTFLNEQPDVQVIDYDWNWQDYRHRTYRKKIRESNRRGRGMIIETGENEFLVAGDAFRVIFVPRSLLEEGLPSHITSEYLLCRCVGYLSVEEGYFDRDGNFLSTRKRNGDESDFGVWVQPDVGVVRVRLG